VARPSWTHWTGLQSASAGSKAARIHSKTVRTAAFQCCKPKAEWCIHLRHTGQVLNQLLQAEINQEETAERLEQRLFNAAKRMLSGASIFDTLDRSSISFCGQQGSQDTQQNG
jgi:hypothetical protein